MARKKTSMTKGDLIIGAPFTGFLTFILLTWSAGLTEASLWKPYITDATVSVIATMASVVFTKVVSTVRFLVSLLVSWVAWKLQAISCRAVLNCEHQSPKSKEIARKQLDKITEEYVQRVSDSL